MDLGIKETTNLSHVKKCEECNRICYVIRFQQNFKNWTSGNNDIDKFIQDTQLSSHNDLKEALEWIPYNRLYYIKYIAEDEFGEVYKANWIDGNISCWNNKNKNWKRYGSKNVILKSLNNLKNIRIKLMDEINIPFGITQDPETKSYMMVLMNNTICKKCNYTCYAMHFQQNFENWTSGNDDIDIFIQDSQLLIHNNIELFTNALEWIPHDRFYDIIYTAKGGFGKVYRANWIDGYLAGWDNSNQNWKRYNKDMFVALKSLDNSKNVTLGFMNEIMLHNKVKMDNNAIVRLYGITQDPKTKNYIMVLEYAEDGSLRNYLDKEYNKLNWIEMFKYLHYTIIGLKCIHEKELIHRDLHIGNILKFKNKTTITDMGLCKPADCYTSENTKNKKYGVLPYIAPEILRGQNYTTAADIYSFGIVMYEVISGLPPYHDLNHDNNLAIKVCKGIRPRFNIKVPQLIVHLIKKCLDSNPLNRPTAEDIYNILLRWQYEPNDKQTIELQAQIKEADEINNNSSNSGITSNNLGISYNTHSEAIYTSRLLDFNNLPEPKNSDDYYEQNDNIISEKFSESLQIDISQLDINMVND
ncbi:kinase-like domain-containing protein [Rhizophagus irregularis DAOM 181602=DAOM 197198]|uniref:Kinase-like domain-containing protein n=1 Tax=Rhizophagus irregularis (strain DAOM 181602 / DAOM 197198 / MUCL 43194) TaxID=747089 RepID=A0A2H5TD23_RHIID|nr:kinase-like domain-containing protein [Rhizophagus irregularis DAOM 181602=DAOM 197198]POG60887.1 kinase-like domain-containing protein [Rhizophagus irregularis DAOM 181602=DAOM 197198]|eukprot:XP_025167753.1 kinase-like domain-containing protein [Rhizophagus irregularis DAOM 181602=DAOM 197198]